MTAKKKGDGVANINFYEKIGKKYIIKVHNPNFDEHRITVPFRSLIVGSSGSMKTNTLMNMIKVMSGTFERLVVCLKSKDEPLYMWLADKLKDQVEFHEGLTNLPNVDSFSKEQQTLVVLDDLVLEKNQSQIEEFYIRARKKGCSLVYISQDFYRTPKAIRNNLTHLFVKTVSSMKNLNMIMRECSLGVDKKLFIKMYEECTKEKNSFLLIDLENGEMNRKFRKNFDQFFWIQDERKDEDE